MVEINKNSVHAFIISWDGMHNKANSIAKKISGHVEKLHIIYSNTNETDEFGSGDWIKLNNHLFFGAKFKQCLDLYVGGIFLLIHADADCHDWVNLINICKRKHLYSNDIGVWAPSINDSWWSTNHVEIAKSKNLEATFVMQTDAIVFSLTEYVVERMKKFDYKENNLGWGIDWAAITYCYCNNKMVIRDDSIFIEHPKGTGYQKKEATKQMNIFLNQLTNQEKIMFKLLSKFVKV